jgi:TPR repeat protein
VSKNIEKAIEFLTRSAKWGNSQSLHQLFCVYNEEGPHRDVKKAYYYFEKALLKGVSYFDEFN